MVVVASVVDTVLPKVRSLNMNSNGQTFEHIVTKHYEINVNQCIYITEMSVIIPN